MPSASIWITGPARSGKTAELLQQFCRWASQPTVSAEQAEPTILVFAANGDNRIELADRIVAATEGKYAFDSTTPLGFFQDEVTLFWPLLVQKLRLNAPFPLRLHPEAEQELATRLWRPELDTEQLRQEGVREYYLVRRTLDILQLAALSATPIEDIPTVLQEGLATQEDLPDLSPDLWSTMGEVLLRWRAWCLEHGLLSYGILSELYWRYLLPHPTYQHHLCRRYRAVLADDVDEYPAIARSVFDFLLDQGIPGAFTYNPTGASRLGLGADPQHLEELSARCQHISLTQRPDSCLGATWGAEVPTWIGEPLLLPTLPASIQTIQTMSRAQLLRQTAEVISEAIQLGQIEPQDVAIIGPGLDAIARYTLREILTNKGIEVESLHDQQPLISAPMIRALLTLMALVYPGLGRLLNRDAIAEMLVVLSQNPGVTLELSKLEQFKLEQSKLELAGIDPVRAGLLTDYCFVADPDHPRLLRSTTFPRWDRLGYQATQAYEAILEWIDDQKLQQQQRMLPSPVTLLDRAIQRFLYGGSHLPYDQLSALRELVETAQHYWEVDHRLRRSDRSETPAAVTVGRFIQLLRDGTITADPYPARPLTGSRPAVAIATIFQYRASRRIHRWQFWLDAGSALWLSGGGPLFGAPLFLREWTGRPWTAAAALAADQERLQRQLFDLLSRANERIFLCHSELATNGQEQNGPLLSLINAALPVVPTTEENPFLDKALLDKAQVELS